jgi:hypothetical protein
MPRASGIYTLPTGNPVVTGTTITSNWANTTLTDIATTLTNSLASDGQTPLTGNIQMNNFAVTGMADPTSAQDAATKIYVDTFVGALGTMSTQNANAVAITGGTISGLSTPLALASGGTGGTTATGTGAIVKASSPTVTTPTIATIKSAAGGTATVFQDSAGTEVGQLSKAWVKCAPSTGTINAAFNVASVVKNSTGNYTFTFTNAFADANYAAVFTILNATNNRIVNIQSQTASSITVACGDGVGAPNDVSGLSGVFFR